MTEIDFKREHAIAINAARQWLTHNQFVPTTRFERERFEVLIWQLLHLKEYGERHSKDVSVLDRVIDELRSNHNVFERIEETWMEY